MNIKLPWLVSYTIAVLVLPLFAAAIAMNYVKTGKLPSPPAPPPPAFEISALIAPVPVSPPPPTLTNFSEQGPDFRDYDVPEAFRPRPVACGFRSPHRGTDESELRGWMLLGVADDSETRWLSENSFTYTNLEDGLPMYFEGPPCGLMDGDHIQLTAPLKLLVLDFGKMGKDNLLMPPWTRAQFTADDWIEPPVPSGTKLEIDAISLSRLSSGYKAVWAFVHELKNAPER